MKLTTDKTIGLKGESGLDGPNDGGYLCIGIRKIAEELIGCSRLWSEGHYPHSNAKVMPEEHPIAVALAALAKLDSQIAGMANFTHDPALFTPYVPSLANQTRWNSQ